MDGRFSRFVQETAIWSRVGGRQFLLLIQTGKSLSPLCLQHFSPPRAAEPARVCQHKGTPTLSAGNGQNASG